MALHTCKTPECAKQSAGRNLFCSDCWDRIPRDLRASVRNGTEKGTHTLKSTHDREWISAALRYTQSGRSA